MVTALICSAGMGLPVSGFPNMTAWVLVSSVPATTFGTITDTQDHAGEQVGSEVHWRIGFLEERYPGVHFGDICEWLGFLGQGRD